MKFRRLAALAIVAGASASWLVHSSISSAAGNVCDTSIYTVNSNKVKKGKTIKCSDNMVTRRMATGEFKALNMSAMTVEYTPSAAPLNVRLSAPDNLIDYIRLSVSKGVLNVEVERSYECNDNNRPKLLISGSGLSDFNLSSASQAVITAPLVVAANMRVELEGASSMYLDKDLKCGRLAIEANGASRVTMNEVSATALAAGCEGASSLKISGLSVSENVSVTGDGASSLKLSAITAPTVSISVNGASNATLSGHVTNAILSADGASKIDAGDLLSLRANLTANGVSKIICNTESITKVSTGMSDIVNKR